MQLNGKNESFDKEKKKKANDVRSVVVAKNWTIFICPPTFFVQPNSTFVLIIFEALVAHCIYWTCLYRHKMILFGVFWGGSWCGIARWRVAVIITWVAAGDKRGLCFQTSALAFIVFWFVLVFSVAAVPSSPDMVQTLVTEQLKAAAAGWTRLFFSRLINEAWLHVRPLAVGWLPADAAEPDDQAQHSINRAAPLWIHL